MSDDSLKHDFSVVFYGDIYRIVKSVYCCDYTHLEINIKSIFIFPPTKMHWGQCCGLVRIMPFLLETYLIQNEHVIV